MWPNSLRAILQMKVAGDAGHRGAEDRGAPVSRAKGHSSGGQKLIYFNPRLLQDGAERTFRHISRMVRNSSVAI